METVMVGMTHQVEDYEELSQLFELQRAYVMRKKINFSFVILTFHDDLSNPYMTYYQEIQRQLRNSDFAFKHGNEKQILLVLSISGVTEAKSFLKRLEGNFAYFEEIESMCITEVANAKYALDEILETSFRYVENGQASVKEPLIVQDFMVKEKEVIKVSIIESDIVTSKIFNNLMSNIVLDNMVLDIKIFTDGLTFIESDWYRSAHNHIILMNDILPKKNGFEVLHYLRSLPNEQKYLIYFVSNRVSEDAQLTALESGTDAYFTRPFNLKIVETQLINYLRRL